ncbi:hypothetical protein ABNP34_16470 (plasmid) [Glutamicibacter mishrai]|uniref:hypothetical protein n=1 Tax=Glutamicibacter mishrai TaxID=1775880 RepID=UPI0032EDBF3B
MENDEESDISMEFGRVLRMALGSAMQVSETKARQAMQQQQSQEQSSQLEQRESQNKLAWNLNTDLKSSSFAHMSGEQIADRMTVASHLAPNFTNAAKAYMAGSDRLRNEMGINIEDINRNHPLSAEDRHAALRNAIDDYRASARMNQEASAERGLDEPEATAQAEIKDEQSQAREEAAEGHLYKAEKAEGEVQLDVRDRDAAEGREAVNAPSLGRPETQHATGVSVHPDGTGHGSKTAAAVLARARAVHGFPTKPGEAVRFGKSSRPAAQHGSGQARKRGQSAEVSR